VNNIFFFLIAVTCLITIHELGHFVVARILSTRVEVFSIGFGKPIFARSILKGQTLFKLGILPIGGYVKFAEPDGSSSQGTKENKSIFFRYKPSWVRILIAAAGPFANLLLTFCVFLIIFSTRTVSLSSDVGYVSENSPAGRSGIVFGDSIIEINNRSVGDWQDVLWELFRAGDAEKFPIKIQRQVGNKLEVRELEIVSSGRDSGSTFGLTHISQSYGAIVADVTKGAPASDAGFHQGDRIISVNGKPIRYWLEFVEIVRASPGEGLLVRILRGATEVTLKLTPDSRVTDIGEIGWVGATSDAKPDNEQITTVARDENFYQYLSKAIFRTLDLVEMTCDVIAGIISGNLPISNISGPIGIASHAGASAQVGFYAFLFFIGVISVSVAVINLFPLPALDGGQIALYFFESIWGRPVSEKFLLWWGRVGAVTIVGIMFLAFVNDFHNIFR
jgi:regulator of sigma E protease